MKQAPVGHTQAQAHLQAPADEADIVDPAQEDRDDRLVGKEACVGEGAFFLHMSNEQNTQTKANQPPKVALMTMTTGPNVAATCEENEGAHT